MKKTAIMFICHGNICRSPMAEFILKDLVRQAGMADNFIIESSATSTEELGNPVYPPAQRILARHGLSCTGKRARQIQKQEYDQYDMFLVMDQANKRNLLRIFQSDPQNKIRLLMDFTDTPGREVSDPWYTDDFESAWRDISDGCCGLLEKLIYFDKNS